MTATPDLLSLAARFARLPGTQRKQFLAKLGAAGIDFRMLPIPPREDRAASAPASFAQTRLWLHARLLGESAAYHITERLRLDGALDANALRLSCDALIARHEALRTTFAEGADGVLQTVHAPTRCPWRFTDFADAPAAERDARAAAVAARDEAEPFDLAHGPLLRAHLIRLDASVHWLVLTTHHIVSDGWSADVMLAELSSFYRSFATGDAVSLAPLPIQYADYALWQRRWLDAGEGERQLAYWRATLDASRDVLLLPGAATRPAQRSASGARHTFDVPAALAQRARSLAQTRRATPFAVLLAALATLLARASGEPEIRIGVPSANRERGETVGLIGFFVNTLALAVRTPATRAFETLVDATQRGLVDAQSHQDVPFDQVVDALGVARSASHHPLFQVMAAYGAHRALPSFADVRATELPSGMPYAKFDLTLSFDERDDGGLDARFVYATDIFDADAIERLAARYVELLAHAVDAPGAAIGDLQWLPDAERRELAAWNGETHGGADRERGGASSGRSPVGESSGELSGVSFGKPPGGPFDEPFVPVHDRIAEHARRRPDARGVADVARALTRGEVERRATRLAKRLVAAGVRAEMRVGVALSRSVDLLVGLIAALKSGGAFVPLDPSHPRERLAQMLDDAQIAHVITERGGVDALPLAGAARAWLVDDEIPDAEIDGVALPDVSPHQAAYVIYTSGSTGKPKGVVVDHGAFARHCDAIAARYGATERDVFMLFQSVNFDGAHEGWFSQYLSGAAVAVTADTLWPPARTCALIAREGVTMTYVPPGCATQLAEWALEHGAPPTLRSITVGGEATSREAFALMRRAFPNARVVNGYGPTETVITPMLWMFEPGDDPAKLADAAYLPIGTLVGARTAHVFDARLNPLPVGVIGELYLGGEGIGVARGYLGRAALTAERFVPDPYGAPGARLYRTGDLVRRRADGVFDFIGRIDHQVKLRGLRIELGEIEAQLAAHDDVREAVAVVFGNGAQARLVAYVELTGDARERARCADAAELDAHLRRTLPDYMVPAHIVVLDALPRNANSKVDRAALPEPAHVARAYEAPVNDVEAALADIWREVLGVERVGRADHFFELGGHSLAAVRVATRVAERLARDVPVRALFEAPILAPYAQRVSAAAPAEAARGAGGAPAAAYAPDADGVLPLSAAQRGLWFLWRAQPDSAAYNIPVALRLRGALDVDALAAAFAHAAARHPALRTRIVARADGAPGQRIAPARDVALPVVDLGARPELADEPARLAAAAALTDADALAPFDLAADAPLWRVRVVRLGAADHVLSLVVHHIVSDGQSIDLWLDEVRAAYVARLAGGRAAKPSEAPEAPHAPAADALVLPAAAPHARLSFWREALAGAPSHALPPPRTGRAVAPRWDAGRLAFELDDALARRARAMALDAHATLPMLLHAALNAAFYRATGATDQPVGVLASTRELTGDAAERSLGLFINAVVVRTRLASADTPTTLVAAVRDAALAAYAHADAPFSDVVAALRAPRAVNGNPLFQVMFNYLRPAGAAARDWAGLAVDGFNDVRHRVVFELELDVVEHPDGRVTGAFSYATERVDGAFVAALAADYLDVVRGFVDAPARALGASAARFPLAAHDGHDALAAMPPPSRAPNARVDARAADRCAHALAGVWRACFERAAPAPDGDLFEAGATSFDVVRFVDAAQAAGFALAIADVFAAPSFAALGALAIRAAQAAGQPATEGRDAD
ncbi:non-ribosomal peptide synthetase [Burkholderia oklahomensis]|uniref:non-ribosomal peptide synthetase n=3 Tax=Burkholderia oklahomensis TaxID=342113 RepID=UPI0005D7EEAB|nr:non-ribosomal peptide synthetase [Burkholderia oklahomensis]AJX32018.1 amino acid adenylation domain protein [Burkholderia oklahomensis C6786]AOI46023.1 non-ribosomal peptide synthetase [Burkholderia oklahomensis C6786]KUY54752.1 non-ribosomal peptide synthetase [Burkholderia oklahomensis C6786]MBI0361423.1 non-ribosomal peptide synthetase [Burkholderia oklahomensis]SUW55378.1 Tyrocidine synthase III [Burkholderia oklahomensis]